MSNGATSGVVDVTPAGDVYLDGIQVKECSSHDPWDCPPSWWES